MTLVLSLTRKEKKRIALVLPPRDCESVSLILIRAPLMSDKV
jgi:hypothetical protein